MLESRGETMRKLRKFALTAMGALFFATADSQWSFGSDDLVMGQPITDFFRICRSDEGLAEMRQLISESVRANDPSVLLDGVNALAHCGWLDTTVTPIEESDHSPIESWNLVFDEDGLLECDLGSRFGNRAVKCTARKQTARFYVAEYTKLDGTIIKVVVEVFPTQFLTQIPKSLLGEN